MQATEKEFFIFSNMPKYAVIKTTGKQRLKQLQTKLII